MREPPNKQDENLPPWLSAAALAGGFIAFALLERRYPLRLNEREPKSSRNARNIAVAGLAAAAIQLAERPVTDRLTRLARRRRIGLLPRLGFAPWGQTILGCLLLDCTLYYWHFLTHEVKALWRFHRVHHADLDMDASTGLRFHFGEMLISVLFRALQVLLLGISRRTLSIWNTLLIVEVMFHHSNIALPDRLERLLRKLIVTPRLHGIHHSIVPEELNSNWSSGLTIWDRLHGTFRGSGLKRDNSIDIGLAELRERSQVTLPKLLAMPFCSDAPASPGFGEISE
jgi:sterol desaturase/sphingolipid hydroxylase (fatty acid hydroxylase superfamily)